MNTKDIPLPYDWVIDVSGPVYTAWAHSKDGTAGVEEVGATEEEALSNLKERMTNWWMNSIKLDTPKR